MKRTIKRLLLLTAALGITGSLTAAQVAQTRMVCLSLLFQTGQGQSGMYSLELTTLDAGVNGELAPDSGGYTHLSYLVLREILGDSDGIMALDVPSGGDVNGNSYPDFFEVSQAYSGTSSGVYEFAFYGAGNVQATWQRAAGSPVGSCTLRFRSGTTTFETFTHGFALLEYTGPFTYTNQAAGISADVKLEETGSTMSKLEGPMLFTRSTPNRFNDLMLEPGVWTNAVYQTLVYTNAVIERDLAYPTNYFGYVVFEDGQPSTSTPDFLFWLLSIDDPNDANRNGIPDFSDDPQGVGPRAPNLALALAGTNFALTISGDPGHLYEIQASSLAASNPWQTVVSVTLTNDPQTVLLEAPVAREQYWRVQAR